MEQRSRRHRRALKSMSELDDLLEALGGTIRAAIDLSLERIERLLDALTAAGPAAAGDPCRRDQRQGFHGGVPAGQAGGGG
jgi:hypothetical protein